MVLWFEHITHVGLNGGASNIWDFVSGSFSPSPSPVFSSLSSATSSADVARLFRELDEAKKKIKQWEEAWHQVKQVSALNELSLQCMRLYIIVFSLYTDSKFLLFLITRLKFVPGLWSLPERCSRSKGTSENGWGRAAACRAEMGGNRAQAKRAARGLWCALSHPWNTSST